jgi:hypothetical protein
MRSGWSFLFARAFVSLGRFYIHELRLFFLPEIMV